MSKNIIFCFSGTGNCLDLAKNIAKSMGDTDVVMMRSRPSITDTGDAERVGFVFPCYGGGLPGGLEETMRSIRIPQGTYIFGISQSASYAGVGLYKLNKIHPLTYWKTVTHQCSCIWLFPHTLMVPPMSPKAAQKRSEKLAAQIAEEVMAGKRTAKCPPKNVLNAGESKAWPLLASKKAAKFEVSDACIGCGQCEKLCPRGNITLQDGKPVFGKNCIQCLGCLQYCPKEAIYIGEKTQKREHYHNPNVAAKDLMQDIIHFD